MSESEATEKDGERIAKRLARAGLCSRREAERWIAEGRVKVDGAVLTTPAFLVTVASRIEVDGRPVGAAERTRLWRYHKPRGLVTTHRDPQGRPTIFGALPKGLPRVISVGRLDLNSEGLLLLTNDGGLARHLELPATGLKRRYRVRVHGRVDPEKLAALANGITIAGIEYDAIEAELERQQGANAWVNFALTEGKNREIRRICEHLMLTVNRLIRVSYGPFELATLPLGTVEEVPAAEIATHLGAQFVSAPTAPERGERRGRRDDRRGDRRGGLPPRGPQSQPQKGRHANRRRHP